MPPTPSLPLLVYPVGYLPASLVAGAVAVLGMNVAMWQFPEGFTPAYVATATLRRTTPDRVSALEAGMVHHAAGVVAGLCYGVVLWALVAAVDALSLSIRVGGTTYPDAFSVVVLTGIAVFAFLYGLFVWVVLPRAGFDDDRVDTVTNSWVATAGAYTLVVAAVHYPLVIAANYGYG